jgi:hypothetical protein
MLTFAPHVVVKTTEPSRLRRVTSVSQAAEAMLDWPATARRGRAYKLAAKACHAALAGTSTASKARRTFIAAAKEASVFVRESQRGQ